MRIHTPSVLTGFLATLSLVFFVAAQRPPATEGRFELEATPNHVFVLDRDTGKVWEKYISSDSGQSDQGFALPKLRD